MSNSTSAPSKLSGDRLRQFEGVGMTASPVESPRVSTEKRPLPQPRRGTDPIPVEARVGSLGRQFSDRQMTSAPGQEGVEDSEKVRSLPKDWKRRNSSRRFDRGNRGTAYQAGGGIFDTTPPHSTSHSASSSTATTPRGTVVYDAFEPGSYESPVHTPVGSPPSVANSPRRWCLRGGSGHDASTSSSSLGVTPPLSRRTSVRGTEASLYGIAPSSDPGELLKMAQTYFARRQYSDALSMLCLSKAKQDGSTSDEIANATSQGVALLRKNRIKIQECFISALKDMGMSDFSEIETEQAHYLLFNFLFKASAANEKEYEDSIEYFEFLNKGWNLGDTHKDEYYDVCLRFAGQLLSKGRGNRGKARDILRRIPESGANYSQSQILLGKAYNSSNRYGDGLSVLNKVIESRLVDLYSNQYWEAIVAIYEAKIGLRQYGPVLNSFYRDLARAYKPKEECFFESYPIPPMQCMYSDEMNYQIVCALRQKSAATREDNSGKVYDRLICIQKAKSEFTELKQIFLDDIVFYFRGSDSAKGNVLFNRFLILFGEGGSCSELLNIASELSKDGDVKGVGDALRFVAKYKTHFPVDNKAIQLEENLRNRIAALPQVN